MGQIKHYGKRSWWDNKVKTLCGLIMDREEYDTELEREWFSKPVECPTCAARRRN